MEVFINLFALIANIVAFLAIYNSFGKKTKKENRIKTTLIIIGAMYIITLIVYFLSGIGIEKIKNSEAIRNYLMMVFVPVNLIIIIPYSVYSFIKKQNKKISKEELNKKLLIIEIVAIIILILEFFYFRSVQKNMKKVSETTENIIENTEENIEENIENILNDIENN